MNMKVPRIVNVRFGANASIPANCPVVTIETDGEYEVAEIIERHTAAGNDAGAVTLDVVKCSSGQAAAAGTSVLGSTFDLKSTADTPVKKNLASGLASALATRTVRAGESLVVVFGGTLTNLAGVCVDIVLRNRRAPYYR